MMRSVWLLLTACQAQQAVEPGPTFGGDQRSGGVVEALQTGVMPGHASSAGVFSALPLAIAQQPCAERLCVTSRAAWLPSGELLVGLGVDGQPSDTPVDLIFSLDASGSVLGSEDVRAATVEIALDHLDESDSLGIWAFSGTAVHLVDAGPVTDRQRAEVRLAIDRLDVMAEALEAVDAPWVCEWSEAVARYEARDVESHDEDATGTDFDWEAWEAGFLADEEAATLEPFYDWMDGIFDSEDPEHLGTALLALWCEPGSDIIAGVRGPMAALPQGSEDRASRLVLVSDLDGELPLEAVVEGSERGVGTSVLGITSSTDPEAMASLAQVPGAHMLDASEPAAALASWESRFDSWMAPTAWGLEVTLAEGSAEDWSLVRIVGASDALGRGADTVFASQAHGMLGVVLQPRSAEPSQPWFVVEATHLDGVESLPAWSRVPVRLVRRAWGESDDEVALALAWRVALVDAIAAQDETAWSALQE